MFFGNRLRKSSEKKEDYIARYIFDKSRKSLAVLDAAFCKGYVLFSALIRRLYIFLFEHYNATHPSLLSTISHLLYRELQTYCFINVAENIHEYR